jgi:hypothetical protein
MRWGCYAWGLGALALGLLIGKATDDWVQFAWGVGAMMGAWLNAEAVTVVTRLQLRRSRKRI